MKSINEDIKSGRFRHVYLLFGEEAYLKRQYRDRLKKALFPGNETVNYAHFEGKGITAGELIDLAETMPFFAEHRLIVAEDSGFFKNASPELADYMKELPETAYFLFVESEVDRRGKMYKAVKDKGRAVEFAQQDEKTLLYWIAGQVKREKRQIRESTARYLLTKTGPDMGNLEQEMEKLFSYTLGRTEITPADVDAVCTAQISNRIFDMVEAVALRQQKKALDYYYDLLALKEPPMRILYLLARQFRILLEVKEMSKRGSDRAQIAKAAGLPAFAVGKYLGQCRAFSAEQLKRIMEEAAEYETLVKTGRLNDRMSVELFIVKNSAA